jgi:UDP-glucose:(heptosyl)LPS alpha-1,3-glucosyltransferase
VNVSTKEKIHTHSALKGLKSKLGLKPDELVFLFVGTEFKRKGLDSLFQGLSLLGPAPVKLLVAGGGGDKMRIYQSLAKKLGLSDQVVFLGLVENVEELYPVADAYILPTLSDPSPLAPLEAMQWGLPAAFSGGEYCGAAELVKDGEALIIENPRDPDEIAAILHKLMDADLRADLGQKGRALAASLTWEKTAASTLAAYDEVMRRKQCESVV